MDYRSLHMKTVADLKQIAKDESIKIPAGTKKAVLVEMILDKYRQKAQAADAVQQPSQPGQEAETVQPDVKTDAAVVPAPVEMDAPAGPSEKEEAVHPAPKKKTAPRKRVAQANEGRERGAAQGRKTQARKTTNQRVDPQTTEPKPKEAQIRASVEPSESAKSSESIKPSESAKPLAELMQKAPESAEKAQPETEVKDAESANQQLPVRREMERTEPVMYQRPMSTQQRMGARTHPVQSFRPQSRGTLHSGSRTGSRFNSDTIQSKSMRSFESSQPLQATAMEKPLITAPQNPFVGDDYADGDGILEIHPDGYGFLRAENYLPGNRDVYVSAAQIRRFNLRTGDYVVGKTRPQQTGDRSVGLVYINQVNGQTPDAARTRKPFDSLIPVYPNERLHMEREGENDLSLRLVDMLAPIGKGQRGMIVSQPKAGKTTLLKKIANAITANHPQVHLIVLLIDERPEEVTDMKRSIEGEVVYSTFDEAPENHTRVSEMVLERAQRLVEIGKDVVILLDSITRLARAYNLVIPPTGRSLSGGMDPGALYRPKRFFGAARNIENGGSLTIIATALVDTGSRMDDVIFEEFKGTGNMELHLDRSLSDRRIFPAIDLYRSGTRREELLLSKEELEGVYQVRRMLSKGSPQEAVEQLISLMNKTKTNAEFYQKLKGWLNVCEKDGFTMG